ncbi:MAG TPA: hypothetical protein VKF79_11045 [Candidatus Acidoferrum sp.]|nr:hypothetical protein [Candidatus Acidoferrum sp.]
MQLHMHSMKSLVGKIVLGAVALGGLLAFAGAPAAQARDWDDRPVVRYDNFREREAIEHHGYYSRQAEHWRHERREAFAHGWRDRYGYWHR